MGRAAYIRRRLVLMAFVLFGVTVVIFGMVRILPGDPAFLILGDRATDQKAAELREQLGLNRPVLEQYWMFVSGFAHGDMGQSLLYRQPVGDLVLTRVPVTLALTTFAMGLAAVITLIFGIAAAVNKGRWPDQLIRVGFLFALTTPNFWFGILLILLFGLTLHWFPVAGFGETPAQHAWYLFLPALTLALQLSAVLIRNLRGQIILTLRSDYVRTAHAKGLSESLVLLRHVLRNALLSTLTIFGLQFGFLVGGAIVVDPSLLTGLVLLGLVIVIAITAPLLTPYDPIEQRFTEAFLPPFSPGHILGTDNFGRDIWSRIAFSTRLDLQIGLLSVSFPFVFGSLIGIATGYLGGTLDTILMRIVDVLMAFPFLILVIAIMSILGPGLTNLYIAVAVVGWIPYARITRGETLATRHLEYVLAARTIGCSSGRIMLRHILPNVIAPALIYVFTGMVLAILTGATLSFLGLGPQPPTPEWGAMIAEGRQFLLLAWWMTTLPGLALLVVGVALSLIGDGLAENRGG